MLNAMINLLRCGYCIHANDIIIWPRRAHESEFHKDLVLVYCFPFSRVFGNYCLIVRVGEAKSVMWFVILCDRLVKINKKITKIYVCYIVHSMSIENWVWQQKDYVKQMLQISDVNISQILYRLLWLLLRFINICWCGVLIKKTICLRKYLEM